MRHTGRLIEIKKAFNRMNVKAVLIQIFCKLFQAKPPLKLPVLRQLLKQSIIITNAPMLHGFSIF
jgi:hypothetical protein